MFRSTPRRFDHYTDTNETLGRATQKISRNKDEEHEVERRRTKKIDARSPNSKVDGAN